MRLPCERFEYSAIRDRRLRGRASPVWTTVDVEDCAIEKLIAAPGGSGGRQQTPLYVP